MCGSCEKNDDGPLARQTSSRFRAAAGSDIIPPMWKACVLTLVAAAAFAQDAEKFYSPIRENKLSEIERLLDHKGAANVDDDRGITPLMYAAATGSLDAMRLLID